MKEKLLTFFKKETILCIACLLAVLSACIVPPDAAYLGYVDTRVLILLFSLMAILAGFRALGIFDRMANLLLARAKKMRQLALTLVMLCFFSAMLVTNDVALITFVPFTILLLQRVHLEERISIFIPFRGLGSGRFSESPCRLFSCPSFCCFCSAFCRETPP